MAETPILGLILHTRDLRLREMKSLVQASSQQQGNRGLESSLPESRIEVWSPSPWSTFNFHFATGMQVPGCLPTLQWGSRSLGPTPGLSSLHYSPPPGLRFWGEKNSLHKIFLTSLSSVPTTRGRGTSDVYKPGSDSVDGGLLMDPRLCWMGSSMSQHQAWVPGLPPSPYSVLWWWDHSYGEEGQLLKPPALLVLSPSWVPSVPTEMRVGDRRRWTQVTQRTLLVL